MVKWGVMSPGAHLDTKIVPAMKALTNTDVVAVFSRSQERADQFAKTHDIPNAYSSIDAFGQHDMDAVFIAAPNAFHSDYTKKMAAAGKNILCEKPMAIDLVSAAQMTTACLDAGVKLGIAFNLRAHPAHKQAKTLIQENKIGPIVYVSGQWAFGTHGADAPPQRTGLRSWWHDPEVLGGSDTLMATGIHVIDLICDLLGDNIVEVTALSNGQTQEKPLDSLASVCCKFSKGTIANIVCSRIIPDSENDLMVYGRDGFIKGSNTISEKLEGSLIVGTETGTTNYDFTPEPLGNYSLEIQNFNEVVMGNELEVLASGQAGYHSLEVALAAVRSAWEGITIQI